MPNSPPWLPVVSLQPVSSGRGICHTAWAAVFLLQQGNISLRLAFSWHLPLHSPTTLPPASSCTSNPPNLTNSIMKMAISSVKIFRKPNDHCPSSKLRFGGHKMDTKHCPLSLAITDRLLLLRKHIPCRLTQAPGGKTFCSETDVCPVTCLPRARL